MPGSRIALRGARVRSRSPLPARSLEPVAVLRLVVAAAGRAERDAVVGARPRLVGALSRQLLGATVRALLAAANRQQPQRPARRKERGGQERDDRLGGHHASSIGYGAEGPGGDVIVRREAGRPPAARVGVGGGARFSASSEASGASVNVVCSRSALVALQSSDCAGSPIPAGRRNQT